MFFISSNQTDGSLTHFRDGRGVIVGILDTGVDPGAIGLSETTDGKPKVIDIIDCSGSNDVALSGPIQPDADGFVEGYLGRKIKINPSWKNPSGTYRVGYKRAYELYPGGLQSRVSNNRKQKWNDQISQVCELSMLSRLIDHL